MEIQLLIVLIIAFIVLGPERMMDLAVKLGEAMRRVREMWDEVRMQAYMEEINRKVMEQEQKELDSRAEDETQDEQDYNEELDDDMEYIEEDFQENEHGEQPASDDAPHRAPEGAQDKTN